MVTILVTTTTTDSGEQKVDFHKERANGTTRHLPTYPQGTPERETGEWVLAQREEGRTMKDIAAEISVSVPTLRRMINSTLLTQELEEGEWDDFVAAHQA